MKKLITILFLFTLLTACNGKPLGEYDESKEWNHYVLQMVVNEAENYIKVAENESDEYGEAADYYYEKAMDHVPKGFYDENEDLVSDLINITICIGDDNLTMTKIEVERMKETYDLK